MAETVRACRPEDIPEIAGLFTRTFIEPGKTTSDALTTYLEGLLLGQGGQADLGSRVFIDAGGRLRGFIGAFPHRMLLNGRPVQAAAASSLMVDSSEPHPTAGPRLLRAFLSGPQDFSFTETANGLSQRMWESVGGERVSTASMEWVRVLRPAGFAVWMAERAFKPASILKPIAAGGDWLIRRREPSFLAMAGPSAGFTEADVGSDELAGLMPRLTQAYGLRPEWEPGRLQFLLAHAEHKERHGELVRRVVYDRRGEPAGCYLYYGRPGSVAWTLQVLAQPHAVGATLDSLIRHTDAAGCVAVRGRSQEGLLDGLLARKCVFFHVAATMLHSRDKALLAEIRRSSALVSGLAGEGWTRLIGGEFA